MQPSIFTVATSASSASGQAAMASRAERKGSSHCPRSASGKVEKPTTGCGLVADDADGSGEADICGPCAICDFVGAIATPPPNRLSLPPPDLSRSSTDVPAASASAVPGSLGRSEEHTSELQ